jgi:protein O-GlcNAc transferase
VGRSPAGALPPALQPGNAHAWLLRGNALQLANQHDQAVASYQQALRLEPALAAALNNQGHSLRLLRRYAEAQAVLERALTLQPDYAFALNNLGLVLLDAGRATEAVRRFEEALTARPNFPQALCNLGTALLEMKYFEEAAAALARLDRLAPGFGGAPGQLLYARRNVCDWQDDEPRLIERAVSIAARGELAGTPLSFVCTTDSPAAQLACARSFSAARFPALAPAGEPRWPYRHERIRVAYLSGDLGEHAVSYLLAAVIEQHDRSRFDTVAVAWDRRQEERMRARLTAAFGSFIDAAGLSDREIVSRLRDLEIDIAVDLNGHTRGQRTAVFSQRAAPVQVSFLGYPGTSGAPNMDYLIADAVVVAHGEERNFSEQLVRLPHCYLPTPADRGGTSAAPARAAAGLPAHGLVYCAFNNPVKITPELFAVWMRLLHEAPGSVLWLRADASGARANLNAQARRHGIDTARLVFAPAVHSVDAHLARCRLADLFLDTLPYNAHATACDALLADVPVLTCAGRSMASRMGASLLGALGLHELVTHSLEEYEQRARELSADRARLAGIRQALITARARGPLFQPARYCRELENAYQSMCARMRAGLAPVAFAVPATAGDT